MLLSRKLKIFSILTFAGVVFMTISFVSPGWVNCKVSFIEPFIQLDSSVYFYGYPTGAHLSAGLWYFSLCIDKISLPESMEEEKCHLSAYPFNFERLFSHLVLDPSYHQVRGLTRNIMLEIQIMSSIGIFCAVLGFIGAIVYTRTLTKSRYAGLLSCISLSISGGTYIAAIVKTAIATHVYKDIVRKYSVWRYDNFQLYCPWGLLLGGIGCFLILVSALGHLCILSRNRTTDDIHVYHIHKGTNQGIISQHSYTTIAPPGYHVTVGLKVPLVGSMEKNEEASFVSYK
uniref:Uncharacterized protein n=1 Tax=Magallana gigas TaxID=29159 RepID=A0A8W8KJG2_MAGGI